MPVPLIAAGIGAAGSIGGALLSKKGSGGGGVPGGNGLPAIPWQTLAPSFRAYHNDETFQILPTTEVRGILGRVKDITSGAANDIGALRPLVTPGAGRLTDATRAIFANARARLNDARLASTSDLRGNLEKRRILGSSFATDSLARADAEFARADQELTAAENQQQAQNFLLELDQATKLINDQASMDLKGVLTELDQLNFTSSQGTSILSGVNTAFTENARLQADLAARSAEGSGALTGLLLGKGLNSLPGIIKGIGGLFNGGGTPSIDGMVPADI